MKNGDLEALVQAVCDSHDNIGSLGYAEALEVLREVRATRGYYGLVDLCRHTILPQETLAVLIREADGSGLRSLILGMVQTSTEDWNTIFDLSAAEEAIYNNLHSPLTFHKLQEEHFWRTDHPLTQELAAKGYWLCKIKVRTIRRDWRRAWEIIRMADNGTEHEHLRVNNAGLALLADEVYEAMVVHGAITGRFEPITHERQRRVGWKMASRFIRHNQQSHPDFLDTAGHQILAIAAHVSQGRNEKRRRRLERSMMK